MAVLGDLEMQVMRELWASAEPLSVRHIHETLRDGRALAYTTVMTVLDRLAKKGLVLREQEARAWLYRPAVSHADLVARDLTATMADAGEAAEDALRQFVAGLPEQQRRVLAELLYSAPSQA